MEHHPRPQLDPLANIGGVLNQPGPGPVGPPGGTGPSIPQSVAPGGAGNVSVAQSLASLSLGPPSKAFPPMSQQQQPTANFNPIMGSECAP